MLKATLLLIGALLSRVLTACILTLTLTSIGLDSVASIPESVFRSAVTWNDAAFKGELGSMPLGNGDLVSNVWVEDATGDLIYYLAKSDAFDQNSQPIKVGRVRITFDPPIWNKASTNLADNIRFTQTLDVARATVNINTTSGYVVAAWVDANSPVLRVQASNTKRVFKLTVKLETWPKTRQKTSLGYGFCHTYYDIPDVALSLGDIGKESVSWYHRNEHPIAQPSFLEDSLLRAGLETLQFPDPLENLTFGGVVRAINSTQLTQIDALTLETPKGVNDIDLVTTVFAGQTNSVSEWISLMKNVDAKTTSSTSARQAHEIWWASFWERSFIDMPMRNADEDQRRVESQYVYARFLDACDGRNAGSAIKFNGRAFTVDMGKGPDFRDWGGCYWFQNTRQPYYNALVAGDHDIMRPLYVFYNKSIPLIKARVAKQFSNVTPVVSGGVWPETMTRLGTYAPGNWGCDTPSSGCTGAGDSKNLFIRFHFTGSLELALMTLDDFAMTQDLKVLQGYAIPICSTVLEFFRTRFPHIHDRTGKTDMWPAQALETLQCPDPTSRSSCATNPSTDLSGLRAILTRLLALPNSLSFITADMRSVWKRQLQLLPELPQASDGTILPVAPGYTLAASNSENTELYPVHPFRLYGTGKPNLDVAQKTYAKRKNPCNVGWCQDVIDAAMLNLTDDAANQVVQRANHKSMFRFQGFAGHMQDYEPSLDHFSFMRTAMHYMLLSPLDDEKQSVLLFPTWPTDKWDIRFKLHAPLNTVIEAECIKGILTKLIVTPASREADVRVMKCKRLSEGSPLVI